MPGGVVDVVVTDGFTGNVVLKVLEGTGKWLMQEIKDAAMSSCGRQGRRSAPASAACARCASASIRTPTAAPTSSACAGSSVIAHGTSGRVAVRNAILNGAVGARMGVVDQLEARLGRKPRAEAPAPAQAPTKAPTEAEVLESRPLPPR